MTIVLDVRAGRLGLPPSRIADPLMPATVPLRAGTGGGRVRIEARFGRRGRRMLALPRVLVADPLGLATREVSARPSPLADELLVLPRIEPVVAAPGGGDATRIARHGLPVGGAEVELDGIRPLRDGTPAVADLLARGRARRRSAGALPRRRPARAARSSCSTRAAPRATRRSTPPSAPPRRWPARSPTAGGCSVPAARRPPAGRAGGDARGLGAHPRPARAHRRPAAAPRSRASPSAAGRSSS